jgi:hypothetical protein
LETGHAYKIPYDAHLLILVRVQTVL